MTSPGWPAELLGDAITELARRSGIAAPTGGVPNPKAHAVADAARAGVWIERAARFLGCEAEAIATTFADLERDLSAAHPGILQMPDGAWLAILRSTRRSFVVA